MGCHHTHLTTRRVHLPFQRQIETLELGAQALQIPDMPALRRQHLGEEGVDRLRRLGPEAGREALAKAPVLAVRQHQHAGVEVEGRQAPPQVARPGEKVSGLLEDRAFPRLFLQCGAQAVASPVGQLVQLLVRQAAQGAAQELGEGEVVPGEQRISRQRQEVLEDEVFRKLQPVRAGHGHAATLQRPQGLLEQRSALLHEHKQVAIVRRTPALTVAHLISALHDRVAFRSDPLGQDPPGPLGPVDVEGVPGAGVGLARLLDRRPKVHAARILRPLSHMGDDGRAARRVDTRRQASRPVGPLEDLVDELQHLWRGAPGDRQVHTDEVPPGAVGLTLQRLSVVIEQVRRSPLERKDRLLLIADDEYGAFERALASVDA